MIERKGKTYLTRKEASERLTEALGRGYTIRSVDRLIDKGTLAGLKFDDLQWVYIAQTQVEKLIAARPRQVTPAAHPGPARRRTRKTTTPAR